MKKVLVIDDEEDLRLFTKDCLEPEGYEVLTASDGATGLEIAGTRKPGLILLDLRMPGMDGTEVLDLLRKRLETSETPIVVLTAHGESRNILDSLSLKAIEVLIKPFPCSELIKIVRHMIL